MLAKGYKVSIMQDEQTGDLTYSKVTTGNNSELLRVEILSIVTKKKNKKVTMWDDRNIN